MLIGIFSHSQIRILLFSLLHHNHQPFLNIGLQLSSPSLAALTRRRQVLHTWLTFPFLFLLYFSLILILIFILPSCLTPCVFLLLEIHPILLLSNRLNLPRVVILVVYPSIFSTLGIL